MLTQNGTITAHGRTWPLYERWEDDGKLLVLFMSPEDQAEKFALDEKAIAA